MDGDLVDGPTAEEFIGQTDSERKCAEKVQKERPAIATGATWSKNNGNCFAETSTGGIVESNDFRACLFRGTCSKHVGN